MENELIPGRTEFLLYQSDEGRIRIETRMQDESVWLTLNQIATLYRVDKSGISRHLKKIYESGELQKKGTVAKYATVQLEGKRGVSRLLEYYNLDAIISVGYRVNSIRGTQFRIWATQRLREYLIKGFVMDKERLKEAGGGNYFEELLAQIRDIRSTEKVFWRKVLDIYATSIDYDKEGEITRVLFAQVQNKMHWAAHGHTAAEVIFERVDHAERNMGLTNWSGSKIRKKETEIAKNYLKPEELDILNRIVTAYLEFAELQAINRKVMYMKDWKEQLDVFLKMTGRDLLEHAGHITHIQAMEKAHLEFEKFHKEELNQPTEVEKHFIEAVEENLSEIEKLRR